jgi:NAD-reducing hydrogenase large subunit
LRGFGQNLIRTLGDRSIHPSWAVPGGVRKSLSAEQKDDILKQLPEMHATVEQGLDIMKDALDKFAADIQAYGDFPSLYLGLVSEDGGLEHYDGQLRLIDSQGKILETDITPESYRTLIAEGEEKWSYLKFPYYQPLGPEKGMYRVGPLARLNVCDFAGTPKADRELRQFRHYGGQGEPVSGSFYYHYARLIEILHSLERIEEILADEILIDHHIRSQAGVNHNVGIGISEAPRGTLIHHYQVDDNGILEDVNLIIATGQNNLAMNRTIKQIAENFISADKLDQGLLNRVEHGIRVFDPCLSCSTHQVGQPSLHAQLISPRGKVLDEVIR